MTSDTKPAAVGVLTVDLDALARNYRTLCIAASPAKCAAVVKANAYGLGVARVGQRLWDEGCRDFFVATAAEGLELRPVLPQTRIFVLEGVLQDGSPGLIDADLIPVLNSVEQINRWRSADTVKPAAVHLDTGMSRLGLSEAEVHEAGDAGLFQGMQLQYALTHLACADEPSHPLNTEQIQSFARLLKHLPNVKTSIGGSAGILLRPEFHGDLVRPGIALYGGNPFLSGDNPMQPVVTLQGTVLQTREIARPLTVGYGATYKAPPGSRIATVGVGYADGYPRALGNRGVAFVAGSQVPVVGRVSMDLITIDVSGLPRSRVRSGDLVELLGPNVTLDDIARDSGVINYQILTGLGSRLHRRYTP